MSLVILITCDKCGAIMIPTETKIGVKFVCVLCS